VGKAGGGKRGWERAKKGKQCRGAAKERGLKVQRRCNKHLGKASEIERG